MPVRCLLGRGGVPAQHKPTPSPRAALSCSDTLRAPWCFCFGAFLLSGGATPFRIPGTRLPALFAGLFLPEQERMSERLSCRPAWGEVFAVGWMESLLEGASLKHLPPQPAAVNQTPRQTAPPRSCRVYARPGLALQCAMKMELSQQPQLLLGSETIP